MDNGTGTDLKLKNNHVLLGIHDELQERGFLRAIANLGRIILTFVSKFPPKVLAPLASGAVNTLGSLGLKKLVSVKGLLQDLQKYNQRIPSKEEIINDIHRIIKFLEENKNFKVTKQQQGGFLGALAAAFGIPILTKLFGRIFNKDKELFLIS